MSEQNDKTSAATSPRGPRRGGKKNAAASWLVGALTTVLTGVSVTFAARTNEKPTGKLVLVDTGKEPGLVELFAREGGFQPVVLRAEFEDQETPRHELLHRWAVFEVMDGQTKRAIAGDPLRACRRRCRWVPTRAGQFEITLEVSDSGWIAQSTSRVVDVAVRRPSSNDEMTLSESLGQGQERQRHPDKIVRLGNELVTHGKAFELIANTLVANGAVIRANREGQVVPRARAGRAGPAGRPGSAHSADSGGAGQPGDEGAAGAPGPSAGSIVIRAKTLVGDLHVDGSGLRGQAGGHGGNGGDGGRGASGKNGVSGAFDCKSGPTGGGAGGDAGKGGDAGDGGDGGDAADVTIVVGEILGGGRIRVESLGGAGGAAGQPGRAGSAGAGGPRGSASGWCSGRGVGHGPEGASHRDGSAAMPGKAGRDGVIRVVVGGEEQTSTGSLVVTSSRMGVK